MKSKASFILILLLAFVTQAQDKPNIVLILADDLGWGDVGFNGQEKIKTPHLDKMASEGLIFNNFYSGSAVCGPSRAVMLTGLHTGQSRIRNNPSQAKDFKACDLNETDNTLAKELKKAGYATGIYGKWGLDEDNGTDAGHPLKQGFDEFYGFRTHKEAHFHWPKYIWHDNKKVDTGGADNWPKKLNYADDIFTEKGLAFIEKNAKAKKPFFAFLSYTVPHLGVNAPKKSWEQYEDLGWPKGKAQGGHYKNDPNVNVSYAAMVSHMDDYIAEIRTKLESLGVAENTLIIFTSDNGHEYDRGFFQSSGPFRGRKRDLYDGGIHVPTFFYWPGTIKANQKEDSPYAMWDFLPTFSELAGTTLESKTTGLSLVNRLKSQPQKKHKYLYWEYNRQGKQAQQAARFGKWKIYRPNPQDKAELYDLEKDPSEKKNLAKQFPEVLSEGVKILEMARTTSEDFPLAGVGPSKKSKDKSKKKKKKKK